MFFNPVLKNWKLDTIAAVWYSLYFLTLKVRRIQISVCLECGDFSPSLWRTGYMWIFKQKTAKDYRCYELVTSLTLHDEETFGSNAILCLIPARLSQEWVNWLVGMAVERWERCCVTHRETSVWSGLSTQICSPGWWFTFSKLISISILSGLIVLFCFLYLSGFCKVFLPPLVKLATCSAYESC